MADRPIMSFEFSKICADFTRLWSTGGKAKLSVECSDGRAHAVLKLDLGPLFSCIGAENDGGLRKSILQSRQGIPSYQHVSWTHHRMPNYE